MNIEWKDSYRIGNEVIDRQHQQLYDTANASTLSVADTQVALRVGAINLYNYVREHFADEESLMREIGFPGYRDHVAAHEQILTRLNSVTQAIGKGQWDLQEIQSVMTDWALDHVPLSDTQIVSYISRSCAS
jgi:hemerythrin